MQNTIHNENTADEMISQDGQAHLSESYQPPWHRRNAALIFAFAASVLIMITIFIERGIFPFGDSSFLRTDMYHQYAPFFSNFLSKIRSGQSLTYSWDIGMGVNFTALYAYYLASPLNWLILLCPKGFIIEFMTYSIVIKIGLSGLSFTYYLKKHCNSRQFATALFGIFYALSGYMAAYSWNIMWLDCILLFPLIMLGLERLVKENKGFLYCITLGISILSNYYISIMICIFMVLYFIALILTERLYEDFFEKIGLFALYSLIAGALAAAVLLPEIYALQLTASGDFSFPKTVTSYFSILDMVARHIPNAAVEIGLDHWPNIYCGTAVFLFVPLYLINKKIPLRRKAVNCCLLLIFYASFSTNILNFIWHGFHFPNSLPCRQSFLYIALVLVICYEGLQHLEEITWKQIGLTFWGAAAYILLMEKYNTMRTEDTYHFSVFYISLILLAFYTLLLYIYKEKKMDKILLLIFASTLVCVEAAMNTSVTSITTTSRSSYVKQDESIGTILEELQDSDFYRIEKDGRRTKNDGAWAGYPSVSLFSSTANANLTDIFKKFGLESSTNSYSFMGATPLISSLFSVKYLLTEEDLPVTELMNLRSQSGIMNLYQNRYTLPLGFGLNSHYADNWTLSASDPAETQNNLAHLMGFPDILIESPGQASGSTYTLTPDVSGYYYVYVSNKKIETVNMTAGENTRKYSNINRGYFLDLGYCRENEPITLTAEEQDEPFDAAAYRFSVDSFINVFDELNENPFLLSSHTDTRLEGMITMNTEGYLFTSIPYEKGWTAYVDGILVNTTAFQDSFLMIPLTPGIHQITLTYTPEGLYTGLFITAGGILTLIVLYFLGRYWRNRPQEEYDEDDFEEYEYEEDQETENPVFFETGQPGSRLNENNNFETEEERLE